MKNVVTICVMLAMAFPAFAKEKADESALKIGDPAPKLQCGKFIQADAVSKFATGKVYVVEFWATWCGPCRMSIPHLNEIWQKNKDKGLVVIGQDCWERDDSAVAKFVEKMGDKMTYRVALDDKSGEKEGAMAKSWMTAAGQDGIPCAFVIGKDGRIVWIGHPMDGLAEVVDAVLSDKFDWKKEAELRAEKDKVAEKENAPEPAAPEVTLHVCDPAPALKCGKFVQGDPVTKFETNKVYVVEFWATWCGPCRESIPHLNELWKKNKDNGLVVIGQNAWEENDCDVAKFVKKMGDKMTYRVALDDKSKEEKGVMAATWMAAAGQEGIPTAFVVGRDGKIAWIGHPMMGLDSVVEAVLAGKYDAKAEEAKRVANEKLQQEKFEKLEEAMEGKKWGDALKILDELEKLLPSEEAASLGMARFQIYVEKKDGATAQKIIGELGKKKNDDQEVLNDLSWTLVTTKGLEKPDMAMAEKFAARANELAKGESPAILDTYARVIFMKGDKDKAIELEKKAISLAEDDMKEDFKDTLDSYKKGVLPKLDEDDPDAAGPEEKAKK